MYSSMLYDLGCIFQAVYSDGWSVVLPYVGMSLFLPEGRRCQKLLYVNGANPSQEERSVFWKNITSINRHFSSNRISLPKAEVVLRGTMRSVLPMAVVESAQKLIFRIRFEASVGFQHRSRPLLFLMQLIGGSGAQLKLRDTIGECSYAVEL